jgi:hypothetical protein
VILRVQGIVAAKEKHVAAKGVGAALGDDVHYAARGFTELG